MRAWVSMNALQQLMALFMWVLILIVAANASGENNDVAFEMRNGEIVSGQLVMFVGGVFEIELPPSKAKKASPPERMCIRARDVRQVVFVDRARLPKSSTASPETASLETPLKNRRGRRGGSDSSIRRNVFAGARREFAVRLERPDVAAPKTRDPEALWQQTQDIARRALQAPFATREDLQRAYERAARMVKIADVLRKPTAPSRALEKAADSIGRSPRINTIESVLNLMSLFLQGYMHKASRAWEDLKKRSDADRKIIQLVESVIVQETRPRVRPIGRLLRD